MSTKEKLSAYQMLFDMLNSQKEDNTEDDKKFRKNTKEQITNRDEEYTKLLSHFVHITQIRNRLKEFFKWTFYLVVIGALFSLTIIIYRLFAMYISSANIDQILNSMPLLISAIVGFVSAIIAIPVAITKYLFSTKEDENITKIILHTQEHDTSGRQWAMDFKKIVDGFEDDSLKTLPEKEIKFQ